MATFRASILNRSARSAASSGSARPSSCLAAARISAVRLENWVMVGSAGLADGDDGLEAFDVAGQQPLEGGRHLLEPDLLVDQGEQLLAEHVGQGNCLGQFVLEGVTADELDLTLHQLI